MNSSMEDSWEDSLSPDNKKFAGFKKNSNSGNDQKLASLDNKYKFPSTTPVKTSMRTYSDENDGNDILFSPTNSASESNTPAQKKTYNFEDSLTPTNNNTADYLSNFVNNSADLEDSILGELLGGVKRTIKPPSGSHASASTKSTRSQIKLEPLIDDSPDKRVLSAKSPVDAKGKTRDSSPGSTLPFTSRGGRASAANSAGRQQSSSNFDLENSGDFSPMQSPEHLTAGGSKLSGHNRIDSSNNIGGILHTSNFPEPFMKKPNLRPAHQHNNSFDFNDFPPVADLETSPKNSIQQGNSTSRRFDFNKSTSSAGVAADYGNESDEEETTNSVTAAGKAIATGGNTVNTQGNISNRPDTGPGSVTTKNNNKVTYAEGSKGEGTEEGETAVDMGGFVPSFMEPGRQGRRRRQLSGTSPDKGPGSTAASMDFSNNGPNSLNSRPSTAAAGGLDELDLALGLTKVTAPPVTKKPVDPFSSVDVKVATTKSADAVARKHSSLHSDNSSSDDDDGGYRSNKSRYSTNTFGSFLKAPLSATVKKDTVSTLSPVIIETEKSVPSTTAPVTTTLPQKELKDTHRVTLTSQSVAAASTTVQEARTALSTLPSLSSLPSPHHKTESAAQSTVLEFDEDDELDVSGIVRSLPSDALLLGSSKEKQHKSPTTKSSATPRKHVDTNQSSLNDADTTQSLSPLSAMNRGLKRSPKSATFAANGTVENISKAAGAANNSQFSLHRTYNSDETLPASSSSSLYANNTLTLDTALANNQQSSSSSATPSGSGGSGLVVDRDAKEKLKKMQAVLETTQLEKENTERTMRMEIEALKNKLNSTSNLESFNQVGPQSAVATGSKNYQQISQQYFQQQQLQGGDSGGESNTFSQLKSLLDSQSDLKRVISTLELEICRLKDEIQIRSGRHLEDLKGIRSKHEDELREIAMKNQLEMELVERRHSEAMNAAKQIHADEIAMYKDKSKSNELFNQLAGTMKSTTGSIRYIEEQLNVKYKQVELQREGQIEARERLLAEMEEKARERVELAEAEGYKLKGILSHMESVVQNLRSQGNEEKERLKQEHSRLVSMQSALEHEKSLLQTRNMEELAYIKQRSKECEVELNKLSVERAAYYELVSTSQHKLDVEKADFDRYVLTTKRALESSVAKVKEDEIRVSRMREELLTDKQIFEQHKASIQREISDIEHVKLAVNAAKSDLARESDALRAMARQYQVAAEELASRQIALDEQSTALDEREDALREGFAQMKQAAANLTQRERDIHDSLVLLDDKKDAIDRADREATDRKLLAAASQREWLSNSNQLITFHQQNSATTSQMRQSYNGFQDTSLPPPPFDGRFSQDFTRDRDGRYSSSSSSLQRPQSYQQFDYPPRSDRDVAAVEEVKENRHRDNRIPVDNVSSVQSSGTWKENLQRQLRHSYAEGQRTALGNKDTSGSGSISPLPKELRIAQQTIQTSRNTMSRINSHNASIQKSLNEESDFVNIIRRKQQMQQQQSQKSDTDKM